MILTTNKLHAIIEGGKMSMMGNLLGFITTQNLGPTLLFLVKNNLLSN